MASEQTVRAFNDLKEIYMSTVAPEFIVEAKQHLSKKQREKMDVEPNGGDGDIDEKDLKKPREFGKLRKFRDHLKKGEYNSKESADNVDRNYKAIAGVRESYSNWREENPDLFEAVQEDENNKEIDVNPKINNYRKGVNGKPTIQINPDALKESFADYDAELISSEELDDSYLVEAAEIATEYLYECGLNEYGVEELIESLGEDKFIDFVFDLAEDYELNEENLLERRLRPGETALPAKTREKITGKEISRKAPGTNKVMAQAAEKRRDERQKRKDEAPEQTDRQKRLASLQSAQKERNSQQQRLRQSSVNTAVEKVKQNPRNVAKPSTEPTTKKQIGRTIAGALGATANLAARGILSAGKGIEAAKKTEGSTLKKIGSGIAAAVKAHHKKGIAHLEEYDQLQEKSESQSQQQLFGLALSVKRGEMPRSKVSKEVLDIVDSMSEGKIRDFAKTKHKGLPQHVKEETQLIDKVLKIVRESK